MPKANPYTSTAPKIMRRKSGWLINTKPDSGVGGSVTEAAEIIRLLSAEREYRAALADADRDRNAVVERYTNKIDRMALVLGEIPARSYSEVRQKLETAMMIFTSFAGEDDPASDAENGAGLALVKSAIADLGRGDLAAAGSSTAGQPRRAGVAA